jgi:proline-rich protein PRCC
VKRVVEFRPSIDMSVLKEEEDDDDSNARAKRWAAESDKPKGLASILPKPKYSGQSLGLGSGHSSSGRMSLEINNDHDDARRKDSTLSENTNRLEKSDVRPNPENGVEFPIDVNVGSSAGTWGNQNSGYHQGLDSNDDQSQWSGHTTPYPQVLQENSEESQSVNYGSAYPQGLQSNNEEFPWLASHAPHDGSVSEEPFNTLMVHEATHGIETVEDPLANILMKERRKGGKVATPTVIEVKQSELTINKVREDQVRATGIAFGPSYQVRFFLSNIHL